MAFLIYLLSVYAVVRGKQDARLLGLIVSAAVIFRISVLSSVPIQEVGIVCTQGIRPFRDLPQAIAAPDAVRSSDPDLRKLAELKIQPRPQFPP